MLEEHLHVTGLAVSCKVRDLTDPAFWDDFRYEDKSAQELREAALRKNTELLKIAREKLAENPLRYATFSERVREVIEKFGQGQLDIRDLLREQEKLMKEFLAEENAHKNSKLSERAYSVYRILQAFKPETHDLRVADGPQSPYEARGGDEAGGEDDPERGLSGLERVADEIHRVYASDESAPGGKTSLRASRSTRSGTMCRLDDGAQRPSIQLIVERNRKW